MCPPISYPVALHFHFGDSFNMTSFSKKKRRPISRAFWSYIHLLPSMLRAQYIRSQFEACYNLNPDLQLKVAETESEISQALALVHDVYVELNYIDPEPSGMRFNKYLALPTTFILIAKIDEEVVGTISIVPDSQILLPSDTSWDLSKYRANSRVIGEVSSLAIKRNFKMRRGRLLLHLCKLMYTVASKTLNLDGLVIATTNEVEPFYTDVLLFEKVPGEKGKAHSLVKGNPSSCCYLNLQEAEMKYKKVYERKSLKHNLYYFFVQHRNRHIHELKRHFSIQETLSKKNIALNSILARHPELTSNLSNLDCLTITQLDTLGNFQYPQLIQTQESVPSIYTSSIVRQTAWLSTPDYSEPRPCTICSLSNRTLTITMSDHKHNLSIGDEVMFTGTSADQKMAIRARVTLIPSDNVFRAESIESQADSKIKANS